MLEKSQLGNIRVLGEQVNLPPAQWAKYVGENLVKVLDPACQQLTGMSLATVLQHTPIAGVIQKKNKIIAKKENRDRLRSVKTAIESELQKRDDDLLLQNRLSFKEYNAIRLSEA